MAKKQKAKQCAHIKAKKKKKRYWTYGESERWSGSEDVHENFHGEEIKDAMEIEGEGMEEGG